MGVFQVGVGKELVKDPSVLVVPLREIATILVMEMVNVVKAMVLGNNRWDALYQRKLLQRQLLQLLLLPSLVKLVKVGIMVRILKMVQMDFVVRLPKIVLEVVHSFQVIRICVLVVA
jgi:hypothetical protein